MRFTMNKSMQIVGQSRKKQGFAIVKDRKTGATAYSKSPKATGVAQKFDMGKTSSGKPMHSMSHTDHKGWDSHDHMDAYRAHAKHISSMDHEDTHPKLIEHHKKAMNHHYMQAFGDAVSKALVKSYDFILKAYKHHVVGRTSSGKKIHSHHGHAGHGRYNKRDHKDAAHVHHKRAMRAMSKLTRSKPGSKMHHALKRILDRHSENAHGHHKKSHRKKRRLH